MASLVLWQQNHYDVKGIIIIHKQFTKCIQINIRVTISTDFLIKQHSELVVL